MVTSRLEAGSVAGGDMSFPGQQPEYADTARLRRIPVKKSTLPETIVQPSTLAADAALVGDQAAEDMPPIKRRRTRFEEVAKGISAVLDEAKELMEEIPVASHQDMQQTISDTTYRSSGRPQPIQIASSIDTAVKEFNSPVTKNDYSPLNKLFGLDSSPSQTTTQPQLKIVRPGDQVIAVRGREGISKYGEPVDKVVGDVLSGKIRVVFIVGPSGTYKTTLADYMFNRINQSLRGKGVAEDGWAKREIYDLYREKYIMQMPRERWTRDIAEKPDKEFADAVAVALQTGRPLVADTTAFDNEKGVKRGETAVFETIREYGDAVAILATIPIGSEIIEQVAQERAKVRQGEDVATVLANKGMIIAPDSNGNYLEIIKRLKHQAENSGDPETMLSRLSEFWSIVKNKINYYLGIKSLQKIPLPDFVVERGSEAMSIAREFIAFWFYIWRQKIIKSIGRKISFDQITPIISRPIDTRRERLAIE